MEVWNTMGYIPDAAECFETWGGGGGGIFHSAICIPLLKFFKMLFALFFGTSNLHSV